MSESPDEVKKVQFLLTNLVLIVVLILALVLLAGAYPRLLAPDPTPTPTITSTLPPSPTFTLIPTITQPPTPTRTLRPTFTPTVTPTPTQTSTPAPSSTPSGPPTLTPATPRAGAEAYSRIEWTPEQAQRAIDLLEYYPDTLSEQARGEDNRAYYQAFQYAVVALKEAVLRFPDAPQTAQWRWDLAFNLARTGSPEAGGQYAYLVSQALNRGETDIGTLGDWFSAQDPRLELYRIELEPISGYISSHLLQVRGQGSAFLWLLETPGAFQAHVLLSGFDFIHAPEANYVISDLTGDGTDEIAVFHSTTPDDFELVPPQVFDLSEFPARPVPFLPGKAAFDVGMEFDNHWIIRENTNGASDLLFQSRVFPACPVVIERAFRWNGEYLDLVESGYRLEPAASTLNLCPLAIEHAVQVWGPQAAIPMIEAILPDWPPALTEQGKPFPADAKDEWRFRSGVYHALAGDETAARSTLTDLVASPSVPESGWVLPAEQFLSVYQGPQDVYRACVEVESCLPGYAIRLLLSSPPPGSPGDPVERLWKSGAALRASGYFDFDNDGVTERWFTLRHRPLEKLEFWILGAYPGGIKPILVGALETDTPAITYMGSATPVEQAGAEPPVIWLDSDYAFRLQRDPGSGEPYLERFPVRFEFPNRFLIGLREAEQALFAAVDPDADPADADPAEIHADLMALQEFPGLLCRGNWSCDPYYYLLGLTSELAGDPHGAAEAYLRLWWDYSRSPYTVLARLKLAGTGMVPTSPPPAGAPAVSATPAPTTTSTVEQTSAPTLTPTLTPGTPYP